MKSYIPKNPPSRAFIEPIEGAVERVDALREIGAIERDARALDLSELVGWAEQLKNAELRILCGEPVPPNDLQELVAFVRRNAEPEAAEVGADG